MKNFIKNNNLIPIFVAIITSLTSMYLANTQIKEKNSEIIEKAVLKEMVSEEIDETMDVIKNIRNNQETMNKMLIDINKVLLEHINEKEHKGNIKQVNLIVSQIDKIGRMKN